MNLNTLSLSKKTLLSGCFVLLSAQTVLAQTTESNPLDRFRADAPAQQQAQNVPARTTVPVGNALPAPTVGGFQQPGLSQTEIDQALQTYDLGDLQTLEEQQAEVERLARKSAFDATMNGALPLTPDEINQIVERFREVREASENRIGGTPEGEITLQTVSLDPGAKAPILKLSPGHVTTLNIVDLTGQPWPIQDISWGGNFEVIQPKEGEHVVRISPMKAHEVGNLSIQLLKLNTPIVFSLRTYLDEVQYRFDAQIPEFGPNSETPIIDNQEIKTAAGGGDITKILNGTPPAGTEKLDIEGVDGRTSAYSLNGQIYVRTPLSLLSPGWNSSIKSADGMTVYTIGKSPVLLLSDKGKMVRAKIDFN